MGVLAGPFFLGSRLPLLPLVDAGQTLLHLDIKVYNDDVLVKSPVDHARFILGLFGVSSDSLKLI